jgi:hypothetical protein
MSATNPELAEVVCRLEALERHNRSLRRAVAALGLLLALGAVAGVAWLTTARARADDKPAAMKEVRAERFVLVDGKGNPLAVLGLDEDWPHPDKKAKPGPGLYLRDPEGKPKILLMAAADGSAVALLDDDGKTALVAAASKDRQALIGFNDSKEVTRAALGYNGKDGKPILMLQGEGAFFGINDANGVTRVGASVQQGQGVVVVADKNGKAITQLP